MSLTPKQRALMMAEGGLSEGVIAAILGIDLADVQRLMVEANPDVSLPGGVELPVFQTSVDVTYDQMVTLPSEAVEIVPDPGEGKILAPLCAYLQMNASFGHWDVVDAPAILRLRSSAGAVTRLAMLTQADSQFYQLFVANGGAVLDIPQGTANFISSESYGKTALATGIAGALEMKVNGHSGDLVPLDEGGYPDGVLRVTVIYSIIDLAA